MKKFILLAISFVSLQLSAQYVTPGNYGSFTLEDLVAISDGAIEYDSDHYIFNEDITVSFSDTLFVTNDEYIQIGEGLLWTIEGVLIMDAPLMSFVSNKSGEGNFLGIRFDNTSHSYLNNVSFVHAGGIRILESDMTIENCSFGEFDTEYSTGAINVFQANPIIKYCSFTNNAGPAIASGANAASSPQIIGNTMNSNVTLNENYPQINLGTYDGFNPIVIDSNQIYGEYEMSGGIALSTLAGGNIVAYVRYNEVVNNRYGIAAIGSNISGVIAYNYIDENNIQNNPNLGGSGLNFYGGETNQMIVHHNLILNNLWGVTIQLSAQPNLGDGTEESPGHNQFFDNGNSFEIYALYNNTSGEIMALNNYWDTETLEETEDVIFHLADDLSLGEVFYDPIWTPVGLEEVEQNNLSFYPNPTHDNIVWEEQSGLLQILDLSGQVVWEGQVNRGVQVSLPEEAAIYILRFNGKTSKLVKLD